MADPTARFVLTAEDRTARAFATADRNIKTIARSALQFRSVLAGFGVVVTGRMFANWVKDAIEVNKLTAEQAKAIGGAKNAVTELNSAFQDIARTAVATLAPALAHAAKFWKEFLFPSSSQFGANADAIREQINAQIREVERLQTLLNTQSTYNEDANAFQRFVFGELDTSETTRQLAAARQELDRLRQSWSAAMGVGTTPFQMPSRIGDVYEKFGHIRGALGDGVLKRPDIKMDFLDEFEEIAVEARRISEDELLKPFDFAAAMKMFEPIKKEAMFTAEFLGDSFRDAFEGWIFGTERSFRDMLKRMAASMATSALFQGLASFFPGGSFLNKFFGGSRASGGYAREGMVYRVHPGEAFFTPGQNGHVGAAGGGSVNYYDYTSIDARGADQSLIARLPGVLAENRRQTQAELRELMRRRRF